MFDTPACQTVTLNLGPEPIQHSCSSQFATTPAELPTWLQVARTLHLGLATHPVPTTRMGSQGQLTLHAFLYKPLPPEEELPG